MVIRGLRSGLVGPNSAVRRWWVGLSTCTADMVMALVGARVACSKTLNILVTRTGLGYSCQWPLTTAQFLLTRLDGVMSIDREILQAVKGCDIENADGRAEQKSATHRNLTLIYLCSSRPAAPNRHVGNPRDRSSRRARPMTPALSRYAPKSCRNYPCDCLIPY